MVVSWNLEGKIGWVCTCFAITIFTHLRRWLFSFISRSSSVRILIWVVFRCWICWTATIKLQINKQTINKEAIVKHPTRYLLRCKRVTLLIFLFKQVGNSFRSSSNPSRQEEKGVDRLVCTLVKVTRVVKYSDRKVSQIDPHPTPSLLSSYPLFVLGAFVPIEYGSVVAIRYWMMQIYKV